MNSRDAGIRGIVTNGPGARNSAWLLLWASLAALNLSAGLVISSWPERQSDLDNLRRWTAHWIEGRDVYNSPEDAPTYPPHAIVALSPLGFATLHALAWWWAPFNLALAAVVVGLTVRLYRPDAPLSASIVTMLMWLCWGGFRALLQFTLLTLAFGLASMVLSRKRPISSGVLLGLALMKPQVAAPFVIWNLAMYRVRPLIAASGIVVIGFAAYCVRTTANPIDVLVGYASILEQFYIRDDIGLDGFAQLQPLIAFASGGTRVSNLLALTVCLALLAVIIRLALRERQTPERSMFATPAIAAVWSLVTFYHLSYGSPLLLPVAALLLWSGAPHTKARRLTFWSIQLLLMFDPATLWRWFGRSLFPTAALSTDIWIQQIDRVWMLGLLIVMLMIGAGAARSSRSRAAAVVVQGGGGDDREQNGVRRHA
jgi:hypothetical protein